MIHVIDKKDCCGCGACAQSCPVGCISMQADGEGFLYPVVDGNRCVHCDVCSRACPILNRGKIPADVKMHVAFCKDEDVRRTSSSGGVFSLLAEHILNDGGVVFGAGFDEEFSVRHMMIERREDLPLIKGSKYLQSRIENTYKQAEDVLKTGRSVLFSGTGCQIAGLKKYLKIEYNNLYAVDVLCHGVPSPSVWRMYLERQESIVGSKAKRVFFRAKTRDWHGFSMRIEFTDGSVYDCIHGEDAFMRLFLDNLCLRPSCYDCKFRESRSGADLTLGDAWGVDYWMPHMDDNKGTSVVVVNTEKGDWLWNSIQRGLCSAQGNADEIIPSNPVYKDSVKAHCNRKKFFETFSAGASLDDLVAMTKKPLWYRGLAFGKRCIKKLLKLCGFRIFE